MPLPPATFVFAADALTGGAPTNLASGAGTDAAATGALTGTISVGAANDGAGVSRPAFVLGGGHIDPAVTNAHVALVGRGFSFFARVRCAAGAQQRFTSTFEASGKQTLIVEATAASKIQVSVDDDLAATQPIAATTTDAVPAVVAGEEFDLAVVFDGGSSVLVWANGAFLPLTYGFRAVRAMAWRAGLSGDGPRAFATDSGTLPVTGHARLVALGIGRQWTADDFAALAARADEVAPLVTSGGAARYTPPTSGLALSAPVLWRDFAAGGAPASERGFWYHEVPLSELGLDPIGGATHLALDSTEHGGNDSYDGTYAALTDGAGTVVADLNRILAPPAGYRGPEGPSLVLRDDDPAGKPLYLYAHAQRAASHPDGRTDSGGAVLQETLLWRSDGSGGLGPSDWEFVGPAPGITPDATVTAENGEEVVVNHDGYRRVWLNPAYGEPGEYRFRARSLLRGGDAGSYGDWGSDDALSWALLSVTGAAETEPRTGRRVSTPNLSAVEVAPGRLLTVEEVAGASGVADKWGRLVTAARAADGSFSGVADALAPDLSLAAGHDMNGAVARVEADGRVRVWYRYRNAVYLAEQAAGGAEPVEVQPSGARHALRAGSAALTQTHALAPSGARLPLIGGAAALVQTHALAPSGARLALRAGSPPLTQAHRLTPAGARHALRVGAAALVSTTPTPPPRVLSVPRDRRAVGAP